MYNRERLTRWLFYIFAAFIVASCGGGGDIFSVNGQSTNSVSVQLDTDQIASTGETNVTVNLKDSANNPISGNVTLALSGAGALGSKSVNVVGGVGTTTLKGNGALIGSTGDVQAIFVDAQKNLSKSVPVSFTIIDPATVPSNFKLSAPTVCVPGETAPCNSVIFISGTQKSSATVSATVLTPAGAPVVNGRVVFSLTVANRGTLSSSVVDADNSSIQAVGRTDATGKASVTLSGIGATVGFGTVHVVYTDPSGSIVSKDGSYKVQSGYAISLSSGASNVLNAAIGSAMDITATITNADGVTANDVPVTFSIKTAGFGGATLTKGATVNTVDGQAVQTLKLINRSQFNNGSIVVSARLANDASVDPVDYTVQLSGATLGLKADVTTVQPDQTLNITATLKDGGGAGIPGEQLNFVPTNLTVVSTSNGGLTDAAGQINVSVKVTGATGLATLSANWNGSTIADSKSLSIKSTIFKIESTEAGINLSRIPIQDAVGTVIKHPFQITLSGAAAGATPNIYTTLGKITDFATVSPGVWTFNISSSFPGEALVVAEAANPDATDTANPTLQVAQKLSFASTFPKTLTLQAAQTSLKSGSQTQIIARVTDINDNPVSGVTVAFNRLTDPSNGTLDFPMAVTDSVGKAVVTFTAGANTTGTDKVRIEATTPSVASASTVDITVGGAAVFVSIGTGNTLVEDTTTGYQVPHQITVADAAGNPVSNATVALKVIPIKYYKGIYQYDLLNKVWVPFAGDKKNSPIECSNEDMNLNGVLDKDFEDNDVKDGVAGVALGASDYPSPVNVNVEDNGDGILWPGNPVTLSSGTVTTGTNGVGYFSVNYARSQANWIKVKIIATVLVSGSESKAERVFVLPGLAKDFSDPAIMPPGGTVSFYGQGLTCQNKN